MASLTSIACKLKEEFANKQTEIPCIIVGYYAIHISMILYIIMHTLYDVINDDNNIIIICKAIKISQNIKYIIIIHRWTHKGN